MTLKHYKSTAERLPVKLDEMPTRLKLYEGPEDVVSDDIEWQDDCSNKFDTDVIRIYLNKIKDIPLLSTAEEKSLTTDIVSLRQDYSRIILGSDLAIENTLKLLKSKLKSEEGIYDIVDIDKADTKGKEEYTKKFKSAVKKIETVHTLNNNEFTRVMHPNIPDEDKVNAWKEINTRRENIAEILCGIDMRVSVISGLHQELTEIYDRMLGNKRICDSFQRFLPDGEAAELQAIEARHELNYDMRRTGESPATLEKRLNTAAELKTGLELSMDKLVNSNLRLVVYIAKRYFDRGIEFADLIEIGNLGLIHAAEKFDHSLGYKFSTYASGWVRSYLTREIADQSRCIRLPVSQNANVRIIAESMEILHKNLERLPRFEEIAEFTGLEVDDVKRLLLAEKGPQSSTVPETAEGNSECKIDFKDRNDPYKMESDRKYLRALLDVGLNRLSRRQALIIKLYYGLDGGDDLTFKEISNILGGTREGIRKLHSRAIEKLCNLGAHTSQLKEMLA